MFRINLTDFNGLSSLCDSLCCSCQAKRVGYETFLPLGHNFSSLRDGKFQRKHLKTIVHLFYYAKVEDFFDKLFFRKAKGRDQNPKYLK